MVAPGAASDIHQKLNSHYSSSPTSTPRPPTEITGDWAFARQ